MWRDQLPEFVCKAFGYSHIKVLKSVFSFLRMNRVKVSYYIDDTLIVVPTQSECTECSEGNYFTWIPWIYHKLWKVLSTANQENILLRF